ncbi:DbpA RNA binding domain-containing protein [Kosmotoga sp. DU53]|uniref:DbpA RNA binding domain-containing protein n=1 Tax=Kosmotoga sp. DU53 TaxID=1310160 RepID=UPI001F3FC875|nr:DbpA RNA binding domain-containing protein [Kosmotoga sp. DU53]
MSKRAYSQNEAGAKNNNRDREMIKLFVSAGSKHNISVRDIVGAITGEAGIPGDRIGSIELLSKHSYVEVERRYAELVIDSLNRCKIKGNKIVAELARAK